MKVNTVEQYKIIEYLQNNFDIENLKLELISRNSIKVIDLNKEWMIFKYENGQVIPSGHDERVYNNNLGYKFVEVEVKKQAYNTKEAAAILGVCENTMRVLIHRKDFPLIKVGRRNIIPKNAFHEWINKGGVSNC